MELYYSVMIRTLGTAGDKYMKTLESIHGQTIKPCEILVVLADGYSLPPEKLGYERYEFSPKGMVTQRLYGTNLVKGEYILFLDDDLEFEPDLVEKLYKPILEGKAEVTFPIFTPMLPSGMLPKFTSTLIGSSIPMIYGKNDHYIKILMNGGWSYNSNIPLNRDEILYSQSAVGTCYFTSKSNALSIRFEDELWLEHTKYCLPDDQVMFYKYHLMGFRVAGIPNTKFIHLDAGSNSPDRLKEATYAGMKNKLIFWHRFIWLPNNGIFYRTVTIVAFLYSQLMTIIYLLIISIVTRSRRNIITIGIKGLIDGIKYIISDEYHKIPLIRKREL